MHTEQAKPSPLLLAGLPLLLLAIFPFFFFGGPDYSSARSFHDFWDLGHILYFALLSYWVYLLSLRKNISLQRAFALGFALLLLLGIAIEVVQFILDKRSGDRYDVLRDMAGVLFTFFFLTRESLLSTKKIFYTARALILVFLLALLGPLAQSLADEAIALKQFPFLSGLETPFELGRWRAASAQVSEDMAREGNKSLQVPLFAQAEGNSPYVDAVLAFFPKDWSRYRFVHWSVYNPLDRDLTLTCRIHDKRHKTSGYETNDRFNTEFALHPGWNDLAVSLGTVKKAPKGREMDMTHIESLHFFTARIPEHQYLYIDKVSLAP